MCDCKECPIANKIFPFYEEYLAPATRRAWENTKYDFHAGYNKACNDMLKRMKKHDVEIAKK